MSNSGLDLTILMTQLPHLQQVMGPQHMPAEAQQAMFGQMVAENQRREEHTVQEVVKEENLHAMGRDTGGGKQAMQQSPQRHPRKEQTEADDSAASQSSNASPWTGNIINVKI